MRSRPFGLAAAAAMLLGFFALAAAHAATPAKPAAPGAFKPPEISKDDRALGMKAAPALVQAAGVPCQIADARHIGDLPPDPKTKLVVKYFEVACTNALGFVLVDNGPGAAPGWASCPDQAKMTTDGKPNGAACFLPGNLDYKAALQVYVTKSGGACDITNSRGIGHASDASYYELACASGRGYILKASAPPTPDKPALLITCLAYADPSSPLACKLTDTAAALNVVDALNTQAGKGCTLKDKRYIITAQDMSNYYEVACTDGKGWVLHEDASGKLAEAIPCAVADGIGGGCTLTNSREAETQQIDLYTRLAHKAGFDCNVAKYSPFPTGPSGFEVVELACGNRPDGAVALFPADSGQPAHIYDCAHSELNGFRCSFTKADAAFPNLTKDLQKLGKSSCVVSGEKILGTSPDKLGYIEVACADGNPGYILTYSLADMAAKDAIACSMAKDVAGGCTLPTNTKHS